MSRGDLGKVVDKVDVQVSKLTQAVLILKYRYRQRWRGKPDVYWMTRLAAEVAELDSALAGTHEHTPDWELKQIAAICLNWLEYREEKRGRHGG